MRLRATRVISAGWADRLILVVAVLADVAMPQAMPAKPAEFMVEVAVVLTDQAFLLLVALAVVESSSSPYSPNP